MTDWVVSLRERAGPQSRNAVLGFIALIAVLISVALPDYLEFRSFYRAVSTLEVERDELKGKRDRLVQRVIVRGNASEPNGLYWRRITSDEDGSEVEINRGQGYDTWRKDRKPERLIIEFASHASTSEIEAYDRAAERITRLSREIGVYQTRSELGLPAFSIAVAKWSVPLVWLIALGVALWPVWELRETLRVAQTNARTANSQELPLLSFVSVRFVEKELRVAPSAVFRCLCLVMAMLSVLACWMGYGYATAGYGPTGMSPLVQSIYKYSAVGTASIVSIFLLRISIWGPGPGGADSDPRLIWSALSRRSFLSGSLATIAAGLIVSQRQWDTPDALTPYLRVRQKRRRVQALIETAPGFYWLSRPWPKESAFARPTNYGFTRLVYLESASDVEVSIGMTSILHGYDWAPTEAELQPLSNPPDTAELSFLSNASGGTIRSYWIEHAALDLVEVGDLNAAAELLKIAIDWDIEERLAQMRRISIRLVDLYCKLVPQQVRVAQLTDWIKKGNNLQPKDLQRLGDRKARWEHGSVAAGKQEVIWKLPRRSIEGVPHRVARSVAIG